MIKKENRVHIYCSPPGTPLPEGAQLGAYVFHDGRWEWTRD